MTAQPNWTNQTAFTAAAKGMLKQNRKSKKHNKHDHLSCAYRGLDGTCCGVGFLLPDDMAQSR